MTRATRPGPATQGPRALATVAVAEAVLQGHVGRPVVRDFGQGPAGSPGPGPVRSSRTEAAVEGEGVAGGLLVEATTALVGTEPGRCVGERCPVAEVAVGEMVVDQ